MTRFILIVVAVSIVVIGITYLIHRLVGKKKYAKYIPAVIFLLMGIYNVYMIRTNPGEGFGDIVKALYIFVCATCFISGVGTGVFIDFILPRISSKK
ncbi:hypothetical protein G9F72_007955 [Clostridium estertheticum]|uniref:hypothetical protein n=1 Tax=Clostridium estertheticum TaxID=238834 RepID=UPI0013E97215|nr:hypothetical protein [Clostridium estertheticum]MBZ9686261.1 hypothetical protein [Clostridium estertheticum]